MKTCMRIISGLLVMTHLCCFCLRDAFAQTSAKSSKVTTTSSKSTSSTASSTAKQSGKQSAAKSMSAMSSSGSSSGPGAAGLGLNVSVLKSVQNDPFTGKATFSLPISVPSGRKGMQPNLAFSYASGSGNGMLGVGFSLELGRIERSCKRGVPSYDDNKDIFVFSSGGSQQELVKIADGEYRAKMEGGFSRFLYSNGTWTVIDRSGTKFYFGSSDSSRIKKDAGNTFSWLFDKSLDIFGNYLSAAYIADQNQLYPSNITYTANDTTGDLPKSKVEFVYEERTDKIISCISGTVVTTAKRLKEAKVSYDNQAVRSYKVEYLPVSNTRVMSLVKAITVFDASGAAAQAPVTFDYYSGAPAFEAAPVYWGGVSDGGFTALPIWKAIRSMDAYTYADMRDINADGLPDRIMANSDAAGWKVQYNNGHGFDAPVSLSLAADNSQSGSPELYPSASMSSSLYSIVRTDLLDINADGYADRVCWDPGVKQFKAWLNKGNSFAATKSIWSNVADNAGPDYIWAGISSSSSESGIFYYTRMSDINADGLIDRVLTPYNELYDHWHIQLNNGSSFNNVTQMPFTYESTAEQYPYHSYYNYIYVITDSDLLDINGDNLPDRVSAAFPYDKVWLNLGTKFSSTKQLWGNLDDHGSGLAIFQGLRAVSNDSNGNIAYTLMCDINGDGLIDRIHTHSNASGIYDHWHVQLNTGSAFGASIELAMPAQQDYQRYPYHASTTGIYTYTDSELIDINGDGLPDRVCKDSDSGRFIVWLNKAQFPNYLKKVDNGIGGSVELGYVPSTQFKNTGEDNIPDLPFPVNVVKSIKSNDGMGNSYTTSYEYKDGFYSAKEREFRGFGFVKAIDAEGNYAVTYFKQDDIYKGRPYKQEAYDKDGNLYSSSESAWDCSNPYTGVNYVSLASTDSYIYDGDATYKHTKSSFEYDEYGNNTKTVSLGDVEDTGDEKTQLTEYTRNTTDWLLGCPKHTYLLDAAGQKVSEKWFYYDNNADNGAEPVKGLLTKEESWLYNPISNTESRVSSSFSYDPTYFNLISAKNPRGYSTTTTYDTVIHAYPVRVANSLGQAVLSSYDFATGLALSSTDANNQVTSNVYDTLGRLTKVIGPMDTQDAPGVIYEYDMVSRPIKLTRKVKADYAATPAYLTSYSFYDGLGRLIQSKSPAQDESGTSNKRQVVSDTQVLDARGQVKEKYLPYFVNESASYVAPDYNTAHSSFLYDAMGRLVQSTSPDGTYSTISYSDWMVTTTDANRHYKTKYMDAYGKVVKVEEHNGSDIYTTAYEYDALGNLTKVTDNQGNITSIWYDSLSRKIKMDDPDMGIWAYEYDAAGNLLKQTDAKLQELSFSYDALNRLTQKQGKKPGDTAAATLVSYAYDSVSKQYCIGRLSKVTDLSGSTEFFYDKLGREVKSTKVITGSGTFTVERTYDALDRLISLKYPDSSVVKYTYCPQGVVSVADQGGYSYVNFIAYAPTGQLNYIQYGNGVITYYNYDPLTRRLVNITSESGTTGRIQDLNYQFDAEGNIKNINDYINTATQSFNYDDLDRLTLAQGTYGTFNYQYDSIGNMTLKEGVSLSYGKSGKLPHAVTMYGSTAIDYDANGNMITKAAKVLSYDTENRLTKVAESAVATTQSVSLTLKPGWNFFSLPVKPSNLNIATALSSITSYFSQISRYNPSRKVFEHYVKNSNYNAFTALEYGRGYQIYIEGTADVTLTLSGTVPVSASLALIAGDNLIGNIKGQELAVEEALLPLKLGVDYTEVQRYNTATGLFDKYNSQTKGFTSIKPGEGYYLKMAKDAMWTFSKTAVSTDFSYDGDGGRVKKATAESSTVYVGSLYELDSDGKVRKNVYAGANHICTLDKNGVEESANYYHSDHLGSSNVITNQAAQLVGMTEFTPYGSVFKQSGTYDPKKKFTGKELDASTGLYYYGARYYDHQIGRFTTPDTIVQAPYDPQSLNRYAYCRNNPLNYVDPTGHFWGALFSALKGLFQGFTVFYSNSHGTVQANVGNIKQGWENFNNTSAAKSIGGYSVGLTSSAYNFPYATWMFISHPIQTFKAIPGGLAEAWESIVGGDDFERGYTIGSITGGAVLGVVSGKIANVSVGKISWLLRETTTDTIRINKAGRYIWSSTGKYAKVDWEKWAPNEGFLSKMPGRLEVGEVVDRYGNLTGKYLSDVNTAYEQRGIAQGLTEYHKFKVIKSFDVTEGQARPVKVLNSEGYGWQYKTNETIENLMRKGYLKEIK